MKKIYSLLAMVAFATAPVYLQAQGITADSIKSQLVRDWERAKTYTNLYLNAMPADKYTTKAADSIRTFSQQMLHLASGTIGLVSNGTDAQRISLGFNLERSPGAQSKDSVTYYVNTSYDFAINAIKNMDASKLGDRVKRGNLDQSKFSWLLKAFEHQTHHRGQCTIYIRAQGIKPPNEMLF
jgi:uncharacterized damage-inducible protein DinB